MSFRKIPFQFASTDSAERQFELEKRFGLPSTRDMYVDVVNPLTMGAGCKLNENISSPRLQHRVPIFMDGRGKPAKSSVDSVSSNIDTNKKSNVRIIPIEIEGEYYGQPTRQRTFSGPAGWLKEKEPVLSKDSFLLKRSMQDLSHSSKVKAATGPKVHNIPVQIEGRRNTCKSPKSEKLMKENESPKMNGCASSNLIKGKAPIKLQTDLQKLKLTSSIEVSLKKVESVLEEFKSYESDVKKFDDTMKDKKYRYLDEMLTRCMLRLDDVDTMGNDEVRSFRKSAIKQVQACIDLLESKVNAFNETDNKMEIQGLCANDEMIELDVSKIKDQATQDLIEMAETKGQLEKDKIDGSIKMQIETGVKMLSTENDINVKEIVTDESKPCEKPVTCTEIEMTEAKDNLSNENDSATCNEEEMSGSKQAELNNLVDESSNKIAEVDALESVLGTITLEDKVHDVDMEDQSVQNNVNYVDQIMSRNVESNLEETTSIVIGDSKTCMLDKE